MSSTYANWMEEARKWECGCGNKDEDNKSSLRPNCHLTVWYSWFHIMAIIWKIIKYSLFVLLVTYEHICLCSHNSLDSTHISCDSRSSLPVGRRSCRWSWKNNTVRQDDVNPLVAGTGSPSNRKRGIMLPLPVACASVGRPWVRTGLICHLVVRMWVGFFHRCGEAEKCKMHIHRRYSKWICVTLF